MKTFYLLLCMSFIVLSNYVYGQECSSSTSQSYINEKITEQKNEVFESVAFNNTVTTILGIIIHFHSFKNYLISQNQKEKEQSTQEHLIGLIKERNDISENNTGRTYVESTKNENSNWLSWFSSNRNHHLLMASTSILILEYASRFFNENSQDRNKHSLRNVASVTPPILSAPAVACQGQEITVVNTNYDPSYTYLISTECPTPAFCVLGDVDEQSASITPLSSQGNIVICYIITAPCSAQTCVTIPIQSDEVDPIISGELETCYGNEYVYTVSNLTNIASYTWSVESNDDSFIVSTNGNEVTIGLVDPPVQFSASVCIDYVTECGTEDQYCIDITPDENNCIPCESVAGNISLDPPFSCEGSDILIVLDGTQFLDVDDALLYVIHTDPNDPIGSSVSTSSDENIEYGSLDNNTTYYITVFVGNDDGLGEIDYSDDCLAQSNTVSFEFYDPINFQEIQVNQIGNCQGVFQLESIDGFDTDGIWNVSSAPMGGSASFIPIQGDITEVTLNVPGTYTIEYTIPNGPCTIEAQVDLEFGSPVIDNLTIDCLDDENYIVTFIINGGTSPYTVNDIVLNGNTFISNQIPSNTSISFSVLDANGCASEILEVSQSCGCTSNAGTMMNELIEICGNQQITILGNGDEILDNDDTLIYILHTSNEDTIGTIIDQNTDGVFEYLNGISLGVEYYISVVVGNDDNGMVQLSDPCLSVAPGQPIIFYEQPEIENLLLDEIDFCNGLFTISAITSSSIGTGSWEIISSPMDSNPILSSTSGAEVDLTLSEVGTYTIRYQLENEICTDNLSIVIDYFPDEINVSDLEYECNEEETAYQVSFTVLDGNNSYLINGTTITGDSFTSEFITSGNEAQFIISDTSGCPLDTIDVFFQCDENVSCISDAGIMNTDTLFICGDESFTVESIGGEVLDFDDVSIYVLHTGSSNELGEVLLESTNGVFEYDLQLEYEQTYYVSLIVGDSLEASIDLTDPCLSVAIGQPILFYEDVFISSILINEAISCTPDFEIVVDRSDSGLGTWNIVSVPDGATTSIDAISVDRIHVVVDAFGRYVLSYTLENDRCVEIDSIEFLYAPSPQIDFISLDCDESNEFYTAFVSLSEGNPPYNANGIPFDGNQYISNLVPNGDTISIDFTDSLNCSISTEELTIDCTSSCTSLPGIMSMDTVAQCNQLNINITTTNEVVDEGFNLIYILHTSPNDEIGNIIGTSETGFFGFIDLDIELEIVYYVSAVVYEGSNLDFDAECTRIAPGTPVFWRPSGQVSYSIDPQVCEGDSVEVIITLQGDGPFDVLMGTTQGDQYSFVIDSQGPTLVKIPTTESQTVRELLATDVYGCTLLVSGEKVFEYDIWVPPAIVLDNIELCNTPEGGSVLTLSDVLSSTDVPGSWSTDVGELNLNTSIDFAGVAPGIYEITYTPNPFFECGDAVSTDVVIKDCTCPEDVFIDPISICQDDQEIDLNTLFKTTVYEGTWSIVSSFEPSPEIDAGKILITQNMVGDVNLQFELDGLDESCESIFTTNIQIQQRPNAGESIAETISFCPDDLGEVFLFDYLINNESGGVWSSEDLVEVDPQLGIINLTNVESGNYFFVYTLESEGQCPDDASEVLITINNSIDFFTEIVDPLCFGGDEGSILITDDGNASIPISIFDESGIEFDSNNLSAGNYTASFTDENGCVYLEDFEIIDQLELFVDLGDSQEVELGQITTITPVINTGGTDITLFEWFANQAQIESAILDTLLLAPDDETLIQLIITDENGCVVGDELLISVIDNSEIVLPNVFNPVNSKFSLIGNSRIQQVTSFEVFDRWGNNIFSASNFNPGDVKGEWDGTFNGSVTTQGVYVYRIEYVDTDGSSQLFFGDVAVIR